MDEKRPSLSIAIKTHENAFGRNLGDRLPTRTHFPFVRSDIIKINWVNHIANRLFASVSGFFHLNSAAAHHSRCLVCSCTGLFLLNVCCYYVQFGRCSSKHTHFKSFSFESILRFADFFFVVSPIFFVRRTGIVSHFHRQGIANISWAKQMIFRIDMKCLAS